MEAIKLTATARIVPTEAKNLQRQSGKVPAVLYGMGQANSNLFLDRIEFEKIYSKAGESSLIDLAVDKLEPIKVLVKDVQVDPVTEKAIHIDFHRIDMNKELQTVVPLTFVGQSQAVKDLNGILVKSLEEVEIACLPIDLVSKIEVDVSGLVDFDKVIRVKDLLVPGSIKILTDPERSVASVVPVQVQVEAAPAVEVPAEGAEAAESEKKEEEGAEAAGGEKEPEGKKK